MSICRHLNAGSSVPAMDGGSVNIVGGSYSLYSEFQEMQNTRDNRTRR